jgi:citrate lyase subunit beta/citryl-CoA lyase
MTLDFARSLLFVPGNRRRMLERAPKTDADVIVVDLEDAVPATEKRAARTLVREMLSALAGGGRVFVRVNNVHTGLTRDDLMAVLRPGLAGVVHPKTDDPQDLRDLDVLLREAEMRHKVRPGDVRVVPLIETPRAVLRCEQIATASDRVDALSIGGEDYVTTLGVPRSDAALAHLRAVVVTVAAALGLPAIDTPFPDFTDAKALAAEARLARSLGFRGKYAIHPDQVDAINETFSPGAGELAEARRIVAEAERAGRSGRGAVAVNGRMVDAPIVERARRLIAAADAVAER